MQEGEAAFVVTPEAIDRYIQSLRDKGRTAETVHNYHRSLTRLYRELPEGKEIGRDTLPAWRARLLERGYRNPPAAPPRRSPAGSTCACCPPPETWARSGSICSPSCSPPPA